MKKDHIETKDIIITNKEQLKIYIKEACNENTMICIIPDLTGKDKEESEAENDR